jgi:hypothetical protein
MVWCRNRGVADLLKSWEVQVLQTTPEFVADPKIENMKIVHPRSPLPELEEYVFRLSNLAEVGGEVDAPY